MPKNEKSADRYEKVEAKSELEKLKSIIIKRIYSITVLTTLVLGVITIESGPDHYYVLFVWLRFGVWIWSIWSRVLFIKSTWKNCY